MRVCGNVGTRSVCIWKRLVNVDIWFVVCVCVYMGVFGEWVEAPMCFCGCHSASVCEPVPDGSAAFLDRSD